MHTTVAFYCDMGHVFEVSGSSHDIDKVSVKTCPHREDHVLYDDGTSPDNVFGPFPWLEDAKKIMYARLTRFIYTKVRHDEADQLETIAFDVKALESGQTLVIQVHLLGERIMNTTLHEYPSVNGRATAETAWLGHITEKGADLVRRGFVRQPA